MGVERHAEILEDEFQRFFSHSQRCSVVLPIYFLSEGRGSRQAWSLCGANMAETIIYAARNC